ncbi:MULTISPECIES: ABC transporter permease [unclassified Novosphingobium]|uniref:ABC transporter permease n=1 Tax=unclassified Novosphingobium TaxID=2644732 RepID=UPI00020EF0AF|nr:MULTISPECIES: ABC transporter permease [unclassified Novosphingobium]GFM29468.1 ABC-2 type transporter [Novosphingobium sp. PY1]CCA93415.1 antibiotic transport system permease protein [Novosphingobium sp. PP1Y]
MQSVIAYIAQIAFLCRKEVLAILKDPANRIILLAPAFFQTMLFGYGATFDLTNVSYALLDQSRGAAAREFVTRLDGTGVFEREATLASADQIASVIDPGKVLLAITIPADFDQRLARGEAATIQVILDGRNSSTAATAAGYLNAIAQRFNAAHGAAPAITIERRAWFNPNLNSRWQIMPAMIATLSMLQTLLLAALSVAREREQGTFDQLLVTPLSPLQILVGKALPSILVGIAQSTIVLMIVLFWFRIPMSGSPWLLYLGLLSFTGAAVGIGMSLSALALNMQQAMLYSFLVIMPLTMLSGLLTPIRNMPEGLQLATYVNPLRFGVDLVRRVYLEGAGLADVAMDFIPLVLVASVTLPLAAWLFRHRLA